jgi:hypothetical protein
LVSLLDKILLETNTTKIANEKDGLFIQVRLMLQKYQLSGIHGYTLRLIKLKKNTNWKNMLGKNHINQI